MAKVMVLETEMKQQTVTAKATDRWIAMARETESLTATAMPHQRQALPAKANLEAAKDIAMAMVEDVVARSFPR